MWKQVDEKTYEIVINLSSRAWIQLAVTRASMEQEVWMCHVHLYSGSHTTIVYDGDDMLNLAKQWCEEKACQVIYETTQEWAQISCALSGEGDAFLARTQALASTMGDGDMQETLNAIQSIVSKAKDVRGEW